MLLGGPKKANEKLGWSHRTGFADLVRKMVAADRETTKRETNFVGN